ncbi:hypothetical protein JCM5350_005741 [Sporobolomyces pararoseus]
MSSAESLQDSSTDQGHFDAKRRKLDHSFDAFSRPNHLASPEEATSRVADPITTDSPHRAPSMATPKLTSDSSLIRSSSTSTLTPARNSLPFPFLSAQVVTQSATTSGNDEQKDETIRALKEELADLKTKLAEVEKEKVNAQESARQSFQSPVDLSFDDMNHFGLERESIENSDQVLPETSTLLDSIKEENASLRQTNVSLVSQLRDTTEHFESLKVKFESERKLLLELKKLLHESKLAISHLEKEKSQLLDTLRVNGWDLTTDLERRRDIIQRDRERVECIAMREKVATLEGFIAGMQDSMDMLNALDASNTQAMVAEREEMARRLEAAESAEMKDD